MTQMFANVDLSRFVSSAVAKAPEFDRRDFLRFSVGAGAGLVIGAYLPGGVSEAAAAPAAGPVMFNPFVRISPDNTVTVLIKHLDKGQGIATGLSTLVAEELDAAWAQMKPEFAPANTELYKNLAFGMQGTGGSTAIANSFLQYRGAGAAARTMIVAAAAERWKVPVESIKVEKGIVSSGNHKATLGELAEAAAKVPVPTEPKLKDPKDWVYIGKSFPRLDSVAKTTGAPIFTQDLKLPGMLTAAIMRTPRFGGVVKSVDAADAKKVKGVVDVVPIGTGVAVLATSTYAAIKGRDALKVTWDDSKADMRGSDALLIEYRKLANTTGTPAYKTGDSDAGLKNAVKVVEAEFVFPFLAHAAMEPLNCAIQFKDGKVTVWTGCQFHTVDQAVTAQVFGLKPEDVTINTLWAGGSFGRRAVYNSDFIAENAILVKTYGKDIPIKVVWTREDDTRGGYYRPMFVHKVRAGIDAAGNISGWHHRIVGQSIMMGTAMEKMMVKNGVDGTSVEGVAETPYAIPNMEVESHNTKVGAPPLWWRSVGNTHTAYVMETMLDELAHLAGKDPVEFRLPLLTKHPRHAAVLKLAAEKAGWGKKPAEGVGRGIALHESFKSMVAQVAEIRMVDGLPKVEKIVAAVDCGIPVNPDIIKAQVEGGIGYGLGAVLHGKITLKDGVVEQGNFDAYEVLRMNEMPAIEVHIVPSTEAPSGIGEPGTPPVGPAVANAVAALTGQRVRVLPFADGLKKT